MEEISTNPIAPAPKQNRTLLIILGCAVLLIVGIIAGYFISTNPWEKPQPTVVPHDQNTTPINPVPTSTDTTIPDNQQTEPTAVDNTPESPQIGQVSGIITWNVPEEISRQGLLLESTANRTDYEAAYEGDSIYYKIGKFVDTKYIGGDLILLEPACQGMCFSDSFYRFVKINGKFILLEKYSDKLYEGDGFDRSKFTIDTSFTIPDLEYPKTIIGREPGQVLELAAGGNEFFDRTNLKPVFKDAKLGTIYTDSDLDNPKFRVLNGFYVRVPDGTLETYTLKVDFVGADNVPAVTWSSGEKNKQEYVYTHIGGCGSSNYADVVSQNTANLTNDIKVAGTNSDGDPIYEFKDPNNKVLKDKYDYEYNPYNETKMSYQDFLGSHPVFLWVDPFGRVIQFVNNKFIPQAECAKPVIYLYPEQPISVSVKVNPLGGFLKSDPEYGIGWNVLAFPDGNLKTDSGQIYPYLFWEGRGGIYQSPEKGFVISESEVHSFLNEKLASLGLNEKEIKDFEEFWEPCMQGSPYFFVSFLTNREMDKLAPLEISPRPDTIIRVLMDFKPLEKPIPVENYKITTPARRGFTVVEWGGVLN